MSKQTDRQKKYRDLCNEYVAEFCKQYDFSQSIDDYWVADDAGTVVCIGDYFFDFHSVVKYAVDNNLSDIDDLLEWYDYTLFASEFNQTIPNFPSWSKGCPRLSKEEQQHLVDLQRNIETTVEYFFRKRSNGKQDS